MEQEQVNPESSGRNQDGTFKKGVSGNLAGRPPETLNFKTKWLLFIDKIAAQNNITPDEVDQQMLAVAYKQMQSGDYRYWKDIQDRVYGTAINHTDITTGGRPLIQLSEAIAAKYDINSQSEQNSQ